jgi:hypothetical protein
MAGNAGARGRLRTRVPGLAEADRRPLTPGVGTRQCPMPLTGPVRPCCRPRCGSLARRQTPDWICQTGFVHRLVHSRPKLVDDRCTPGRDRWTSRLPQRGGGPTVGPARRGRRRRRPIREQSRVRQRPRHRVVARPPRIPVQRWPMTTAIHLEVASDRRVETERFLRALDSQTRGARDRTRGGVGHRYEAEGDYPSRSAKSTGTARAARSSPCTKATRGAHRRDCGKPVSVHQTSVPAAFTRSGPDAADGDAPATTAPTSRRPPAPVIDAPCLRMEHPSWDARSGSVSPVARRGPGGQSVGRVSKPPAGGHCGREPPIWREADGPRTPSARPRLRGERRARCRARGRGTGLSALRRRSGSG